MLRLELYGRVQGVGFRAWTVRQGRKLGLRGWVRNRRDGSVEVHAAGEEAPLERFRERMRKGPPAARVDRMEEAEEAEGLPKEGFEVRY